MYGYRLRIFFGIVISLALIPFLHASTSSDVEGVAASTGTYFPRPESQGGWRSLAHFGAAPSGKQKTEIRKKTGLNWDTLKLAKDYSDTLSTQAAILVIRNGWIAAEWGSTGSFQVHSIAKSFTGLVFGKLFDLSTAGLLAKPIAADSSAHVYLPASFRDSDPLKRQITIRHLLNMSSGIKPSDSEAFRLTVADALKYPMAANPGSEWAYASLGVNLLSMISQDLVGRPQRDFFMGQIAEPIGVPWFPWGKWNRYTNGAAGAIISARNLARICYLLLHQGQWDNGTGLKQILHRRTVRFLTSWSPHLKSAVSFKSAAPFFANDPAAPSYYGHLFWTNQAQKTLGPSVPQDAYYMHGFTDNLAIVVPSLNMIAVRLARGGPGTDPSFKRKFMSLIMAAVVSNPPRVDSMSYRPSLRQKMLEMPALQSLSSSPMSLAPVDRRMVHPVNRPNPPVVI